MNKYIKWSLITLGVFSCFGLSLLAFTLNISSHLAYSLVPRYPDSELIFSTRGGGSMVDMERHIYHTEDSLEEVLTFMGEHLPGFTETYSDDHGIKYVCNVEDPSWLARIAIKMSTHPEDPILPSARIQLYKDSQFDRTVIEVLFMWATY